MTLQNLIQQLTPDIYQRLRQAVELGKWPDGRKLGEDQKRLCMEAILHFEQLHQVPHADRVGYIDRGNKAGSQCGQPSDAVALRILNA